MKNNKIDFSELSQFAKDNNSLSMTDNKYYWTYETTFKGKISKKTSLISNFVLEPLYLLRHASTPKRLVIIKNYLGEEKTILVIVKSMTNSSDFKAIVEGNGNYILNANPEQYTHIREILAVQEKEAQEIDTLGYQPESKIYAFGNGIFDGQKFLPVNDFGIVETPQQNYFIPEYSNIYKHDPTYTERRKFIYKKGEITLTNWSKLIVKCYGKHGKVGIAYIVACLFRDVIMEKIGRFPMLYLFGAPQSGKSTFRDSFMYLFGEPQTTPSLGSASSPKSFNRKLAQVRNGLIVFEEYKNEIEKTFIEMLKGVYDGIGYERAETSNDNRTKTTPVNSSVIVCGQEMPTKEAALFSRSIMLTFTKTIFSDEDNKAYSQLRTAQAKGLGQVLTDIIKQRNLIESDFKKELDELVSDLINNILKGKGLTQRWIENIAVLIVPIKILQQELNFSFDYSELALLLCDNLIIQGEIMRDTNEVNTFFEILRYLIEKKRITSDEYKSTQMSITKELLIFCFKDIYPHYVYECKRQNLIPIEKHTLSSYLQSVTGYKEYKNTKIGNGKQKKCFHFEIEN